MVTSKHPGIDFVIGDYNTTNGQRSSGQTLSHRWTSALLVVTSPEDYHCVICYQRSDRQGDSTRLHKEMQITEGWPQGAYRRSEEPVWTIWLPPETPRVGGSRCVIVGQVTGRVIADSVFGE